jgi:SAM-dependent methyltransferase
VSGTGPARGASGTSRARGASATSAARGVGGTSAARGVGGAGDANEGQGLRFNKLCELEDFADEEFAAVLREVCAYKLPYLAPSYPAGAEHRKDWEVSMAVRALDRFGALRPDAVVLGVGAGSEATIFYLTRRVRQVFATDRYLAPEDWDSEAPPLMMVEPSEVSPFPFDPHRLVVQHMDGRWLRYPADTFDGIFSSGSIEHFGTLQDIAHAAYEMGRVLKPGGILSLSTEFCLSGPPGGLGWPGRTLVFSRENLIRYVVEASGLEPVDELDTTVSEATLANPQNPGRALDDQARRLEAQAGSLHPLPDFALWDFPHLVLAQGGYAFGSVHLALRKTDRYPEPDNAWAQPPAEFLESIVAANRAAFGRPAAPEPAPARSATAAPAGGGPGAPAAGPSPAGESPPPDPWALWRQQRTAMAALRAIDAGRAEVGERLGEIARLAAALDRVTAPAPAGAAPAPADEGAAPAGEGEAPEEEPGTAAARTVTLAGQRSFTAVVDLTSRDPLARALAADRLDEVPLLALWGQLVFPGDAVLDLGAGAGAYSLAAAAGGGRVLAVETGPELAARLREAAWRNGFHALCVVDAPVEIDPLLAEYGWPAAAAVHAGGDLPAILSGMAGLLGRPDAPPLLISAAAAGLGPLLTALEARGYVAYRVEPGRLVRTGANDALPQSGTVDLLAAKRRPRGLEGWLILPGAAAAAVREDSARASGADGNGASPA